MGLKNDFNSMANELINGDFAEFKEKFVFKNEIDTGIYDPDVEGGYKKEIEEVEVYGIPTKVSRDILNSGIYEIGDINITFLFNELPDFTDINNKVFRSKTGKTYTIVDYSPDPSDSIVKILMRR